MKLGRVISSCSPDSDEQTENSGTSIIAASAHRREAELRYRSTTPLLAPGKGQNLREVMRRTNDEEDHPGDAVVRAGPGPDVQK